MTTPEFPSHHFIEQLYLQKHSDVAAAVTAGSVKSGIQHYIQGGEAEGRSPGAFDEQFYLTRYPDVAAAVAAGGFSSGLQYYIQAGQFEANRRGYFTGTTENDTLTAFGTNTWLVGIDGTDPVLDEDGTTVNFSSSELGSGEVVTLIGGTGKDLFFLGDKPVDSALYRNSYTGDDDADYALIKNGDIAIAS